MKVCVLGDTHFGVRNDLLLFHAHFEQFYNQMFDIMDENGVKTIIQLGDLWDRRKYINFNTLNESRRYFFDQLAVRGYTMYTLLGNHDIYWRESVAVNGSNLLLDSYSNVNVIMSPTTIDIGGTSIDMIPWICAENEKNVLKFISSSKSDICAGHFEIASFSMYRGIESHDGLPVEMFEKYEHVWSGHYHTRSTRENITYVGTPYEMTWQDYNDPKGFHLFDLSTRKLKFYQNPYTLFVRLDYNDRDKVVDLDPLDLTNCFVKVVVINKTDLYKFDQFVQKLYSKGCFEIKIIEDLSEFTDGEIGEDIDLEDTMDVLSNYIDSIETDADKDKIKTFLKSLYVEAVNVEVV